MLSVIRTPIRHFQATVSLFALLVVLLVVFVVQKLAATDTAPAVMELRPVAVTVEVPAVEAVVEPQGSVARHRAAGPRGRSLPWVRWDYVP